MAGERHGHGMLCVNRPLLSEGREVRAESSVRRYTYAIEWQAVLNAVFPEIFKLLSARVQCRRYISVFQLFVFLRDLLHRQYTQCIQG